MWPKELNTLGTSLVSDIETLVFVAQNHPGKLALLAGMFFAVLLVAAMAAGWVYGRFFRRDPRRDRVMQPDEMKRQGFVE